MPVNAPRLLTAEDLLEKADSLVRKLIELHVVDTPYDETFVLAFQAATCLISPALNKPTYLDVIVGTPPFEIQIGHHKLIFQQADVALATTWKSAILLNAQAINRHELRYRTVAILEEFVHGFLNIKPEPLARIVVAHLFDRVVATETGYADRETASN